MASRRPQRSRTLQQRPRLVRLVAAGLGVGLGLAAVWLLAQSGPPEPVAGGPPLDEIDAGSRARLERVLERERLREGSQEGQRR